MLSFPPQLSAELAGWDLVWVCLEPRPGSEAELAELWPEVHRELRESYAGRKITDEAVVQAVRRLFRAAGCDPTRYRPSSEALARRVLKGDLLPRIHPLVDLNNLVSLELLVPCCVVDADRVRPPLVLRAGRPQERMESMRGPFDLAGKPVLEDRDGPFGTPITDSERVKIVDATAEVWMVAYLPQGHGGQARCIEVVERLITRAPVAALGVR
jgi:DNA/RNA-binding domain of Phe-tRNA-synthetase-like protein